TPPSLRRIPMQSTAAATDTNSSHRQALRPLPQRQRPVPQRSATQEVSQQEQELLLDMLRDDAKAWRTFTHQYSGLIIGCIRRVLGRFSRVTCEHDVDEVYARFCAILLAHDKRKL